MPREIPPERYAVGREALGLALAAARSLNLAPPPKLTLSEWAERHAVLSRETSAQTGRFRAFGYQKGLMDAVTDPSVHTVTVMKSARVGFTKVLDHVVGFFLHQDPSPVLVVQPRVEDAEDYSKTEISPMLRDTPVLADICPPARSKDTSQTILKKVMLNGSSLTLVGANSPGGFRRITARVVCFDEVDGYPAGGAGSEGDQIALGKKRSETFWNRKTILGSTPTVKGVSRIEKSYAESDQREYRVPCPQCGHRQALQWGGKDKDYGIKWARDDKGVGRPETAYYLCSSGNGCVIEPADLPAMDRAGEWVATRPCTGHAGFKLWAGMSLFVNAAWPKLVEEWLRVKDSPLERQTFYNLVLGEPYEDRGDYALSEHVLAARGEIWSAQVPDGVAVITVGIDTQDGRFELEVVGWGANEESWSLAYEVIEGDPDDPEVQAQLDAFLRRRWVRADGREFEVMAACVDSGGHKTQAVYAFSKSRLGRRIWAIKGESARGGMRSPVWPTKKPNGRSKASFRPFIIGTNAAKDVIRSRLALAAPEQLGQPTPGYCHFPADRDITYFSQLLAENLVTVTLNGKKVRLWKQSPGRANEALDTRVYAYAALQGLIHLGLKLNMKASDVCRPMVPSVEQPPRPEPVVEALDVARIKAWVPPNAADAPPSPPPAAPERPKVRLRRSLA
jgi:phage terminase large subunit GpA-like protein